MHYILLLSFIVISCQEKSNKSYLLGISECNNIRESTDSSTIPSPSCLEGYSLPSFEFQSIAGVDINNQTLLGNPSIINFWFIGCPPCEAEIPGFNIIVDKYKKQGVKFIAIGRNDEKYLKDFFEENPWNFQHINDPNSEIIIDTFQMRWGYPTTLIIDKEGVIQSAFAGGPMDSSATEILLTKVEPILDELLK